MVNKVTLVGYVGQNPEYVQEAFGTSRATFSIATNDVYKKRDGSYVEHTYWHDCTAWGNLADRVEKLVMRGCLLYIEGKLTYWEQEKEGFGKVKRATIKVDVFHVMKFANDRPPDLPTENKKIVKKTNGKEGDFRENGKVTLPDNSISADSFYDSDDDLPF